MTELHDTVAAWIADDPDPDTAADLTALLESADGGDASATTELADRFSGLLQFGTAGLRGALGGGPNRMNRAVVIRAAAGLAAHMTAELGGAGRVVIGYDARHKSHDFAVDTAAVMTAAGHEALLLPSALPTPVLAYAVRALDADAGVMVTASHNPPQDNGYKVYVGGRIVPGEGAGAQIIPPHDGQIAARIAEVPSVSSVDRATDGWTVLDNALLDDYVAKCAALVPAPTGDIAAQRAAVTIVLTPLHGVGGKTVEAVLAAAGFPNVHTVPEQAEPDPDFPTVAFPNPEEKGAMDLALALADKVGADVVIANDPDADRCAVAAPIDGKWRTLHGDRVGALLGDKIASAAGGKGKLANSIVSSQILATIAQRNGLDYAATLTGFKWIGREAGLIYGYEEALGYCTNPDMVRDKDGVSAAVVIADLVANLAAEGRTIADALEALDEKYGVFLTSQVSARFDSVETVKATVAGVVASPPAALGGSPVVSIDDMADGLDGLPPSSGIRLLTESGARVIIRPSGTEPKVKAYLEVIEPVTSTVADARAAASTVIAELASDVHAALGL